MEEKTPSGFRIIWILVIVVAALFAARFMMAFGRMFLVLAAVGVLGAGVYYLVRHLRARWASRRYAKSTEGIIGSRVDRCQLEIRENKKAMEEIRRNIRELEEKLEQATQASEESRQYTRKLIEDFQAELELREAKINFLESCTRKLQMVLHNYELSKAFAEKKSELKLLREKNFEDIADLEELRSDIEYDRTYLETIDNLSLRMLGSQSLETVHALKQELEQMTRSLNDSE